MASVSVSFITVSRLIQLLNTGNVGQQAFVRVLGANRLALGEDPLQPTHLIDLSRETIAPCGPLDGMPAQSNGTSPGTAQAVTVIAGLPKPARRSGAYWFEI